METIPACRQAGRLQTGSQCICSSSEVQVVVCVWRGTAVLGWGASSEVPPPAGSLGSEAGIHRVPFPSLGPSPRWTTASHPHPGQLSMQRRKLRQQPS